MSVFRVHFDSGEPVDVEASGPTAAGDIAVKRHRTRGLVRKVKLLRDPGRVAEIEHVGAVAVAEDQPR